MRVMFQRQLLASTDDYGAETYEWADYVGAWAAVFFGTGDERREAAQENATVAATFRVLSTPKTRTISVTDRIEFQSAYWDISSAIPLGLNDGVEIVATRSVS